MVLLWVFVLCILRFAVAIDTNEAARIDGLIIAELDESPALSVPSSEEIIDDSRVSEQKQSRIVESTTSTSRPELPTTTSSSLPTARAAAPAVLLSQVAPAALPAPASVPAAPAPVVNQPPQAPPATLSRQISANVPTPDANPTDATPKQANTTVGQKPTKRPVPESVKPSPPVAPVSPPIVKLTNETGVFNVPLDNISAPTHAPTTSQPTTPSDAELKFIPSSVRNPRVTIVGYTGKPVHTFNLTEKQVLYQVRVFWLEPENWRDRGFRPPNRIYELFCWLSNDGAWVHDLFRQNFSASIYAHSQWFAFPETEQAPGANFTVDCGLRSINSANKASDWSFSIPSEIEQSPVFLRGFDNVNVRGWSPEEVTHLIKTSANDRRFDAPLSSKAAATKAARNCK